MRQIFNDYVDIINPDISVDGAPESKCTVVTSNICVLECASTAVWEHMATYACALEVQNHIFQHSGIVASPEPIVLLVDVPGAKTSLFIPSACSACAWGQHKSFETERNTPIRLIPDAIDEEDLYLLDSVPGSSLGTREPIKKSRFSYRPKTGWQL